MKVSAAKKKNNENMLWNPILLLFKGQLCQHFWCKYR